MEGATRKGISRRILTAIAGIVKCCQADCNKMKGFKKKKEDVGFVWNSPKELTIFKSCNKALPSTSGAALCTFAQLRSEILSPFALTSHKPTLEFDLPVHLLLAGVQAERLSRFSQDETAGVLGF